MGEFNLEDIVGFSENNVVLKDLCDSEKVRVNLLCMEEGQTALEDTNDQKVVVIINTGSGLKDVNAAMQAAGEAPVIEPTLEAVKELL